MRMHIRKYFTALWENWLTLMSGIASIILAFVVALFFPVADVSTNRLLLSSATVACFIISSYRVWANEHKKSLALENRIAELIAEHKEQNKPVLQIVEKQLETSLLNQKLTT